MKHLITIVGPTAIGKQLIILANHFKAEIISTAVNFSRKWQSEPPFLQQPNWPLLRIIQNKSIFENYTVGEFEKKPLKK
jgi:tRNA dimethylallyltransferase